MSDDDLKFKHAFSCIVSGPGGSGITSFCIRLLQNLDSVCTDCEFGGGINCCYSEKTAFISLQQLHSTTTYHEAVTENFGRGGCGKPCLVILDDLLTFIRRTHPMF